MHLYHLSDNWAFKNLALCWFRKTHLKILLWKAGTRPFHSIYPFTVKRRYYIQNITLTHWHIYNSPNMIFKTLWSKVTPKDFNLPFHLSSPLPSSGSSHFGIPNSSLLLASQGPATKPLWTYRGPSTTFHSS